MIGRKGGGNREGDKRKEKGGAVRRYQKGTLPALIVSHQEQLTKEGREEKGKGRGGTGARELLYKGYLK